MNNQKHGKNSICSCLLLYRWTGHQMHRQQLRQGMHLRWRRHCYRNWKFFFFFLSCVSPKEKKTIVLENRYLEDLLCSSFKNEAMIHFKWKEIQIIHNHSLFSAIFKFITLNHGYSCFSNHIEAFSRVIEKQL